MALFRRREMPPADVVARLPEDERVLSWGDVASGGVVLATPRGLWWPGADGSRLIGWQHVDKAGWREGCLTVIEAHVLDDLLLVEQPPQSVVLSAPRDLPATVRKRVEANIVRSEVRTIGGGTVRFVARRIPGRDGVVWWARLETGLAETEQVRALVSAECERLRADWAEAQVN